MTQVFVVFSFLFLSYSHALICFKVVSRFLFFEILLFVFFLTRGTATKIVAYLDIMFLKVLLAAFRTL